MELYAYELLYRSGKQNTSNLASGFDGDSATSEVLLNTFMEIGLERIAGPHLVFINLTRHFFLQMPEIPFEKHRVVLRLLAELNNPDVTLNASQRLITQDAFPAADYPQDRPGRSSLPPPTWWRPSR
jgi:EAL and modified HD-GYP domain-containing signal transduction protein